ncbi:uncharacterized protein [Taeniopygia guttata]|uniref:uncharacterized protein n=1 Tax=Taeniopygia guttata TaxID=59729 RepID=UPI003BB9689A
MSLQPMGLDVGEELHLCIHFNPAQENNRNSWVAERVLRIRFLEHPGEEQITVRGEVHFPNLHLQAEAVDFGCIINDTEQVLFMDMTNCSPIPVQYHWSFLTDRQLNTIRFIPSPPTFKPKKKAAFPRRYSKPESVEEPTESPERMQDSAQQPADAEDSLEAEVDFLCTYHLHCLLNLPPKSHSLANLPFAALLSCALRVAAGYGVSGEGEIGKFCSEKLAQVLQTYTEFGIFGLFPLQCKMRSLSAS